MLEYAVAPSIWPALETAKTVTTAMQVRVEDQGQVMQGESALGEWQVREVAVQVAAEALWPTMDSPNFPAYALLVHEADGWRFGAFVTEVELAMFEKGADQP